MKITARIASVRAFVTGGTGFIGGHLVRKLRERGDDVVALVRSPAKAEALLSLGCEIASGDLGDEAAIARGLQGCGAAFHSAAIYKLGIPESERPELFEVNVRETERVLDAAWEAGVARIVYVSAIGAFGNTHGKVVDETYARPVDDRFLSAYDETKYVAHVAANERIARGAPILIAQPGGVYGPGDTSEIAIFIEQIRSGRLRFMTFPELGLNFLHVEDCVEGILSIHDRGKVASHTFWAVSSRLWAAPSARRPRYSGGSLPGSPCRRHSSRCRSPWPRWLPEPWVCRPT